MRPVDDPAGCLPSLRNADWLAAHATQAVFSALHAGGAEARVVGGAVRNALLGQPVADIDLATTATPEETLQFAAAAGLRALPTGIDHGTVTVIADGRSYEVTTLRRDVETSGRRAVVAFTGDWAEDAARRDFTINALYCGRDGTLFDPLAGYPDVAARRVRFIGDPVCRIREDYLRILRFFRFHATYAEGAPDAAGLAACEQERAGLEQLSGERVRAELLRLFAAQGAVAAVAAMTRHGIASVWFRRPSAESLARLAAIETELGRVADPLLRLAAFAQAGPDDIAELQTRLKLSGAETDRISSAVGNTHRVDPTASWAATRAILYKLGGPAVVDAALLAWAASAAPVTDVGWLTYVRQALAWVSPTLPVRGGDVTALGVAPGPDVGRILAAFEDWWIANGFPADREQALHKLRDLAGRAAFD